jgi:cytochrome c peroxidase
MRGQDIFFGKGQCATCHTPPYYTDNLMHNLQVERSYKPVMINGMLASSNGPIKTFPLRGIKDSPPYLHDGRLPTLDDTVEFFNLVLGTKLAPQEKQDCWRFCERSSVHVHSGIVHQWLASQEPIDGPSASALNHQHEQAAGYGEILLEVQ